MLETVNAIVNMPVLKTQRQLLGKIGKRLELNNIETVSVKID